jgi:hypothetical protein
VKTSALPYSNCFPEAKRLSDNKPMPGFYGKIDRNAPGPRWTDEQVAEAFEMSRYTVMRIRERFVNNGLDDALSHRHHTQTRERALDGEPEAHLIALSCSSVPTGQARWTVRLLAGRMVELGSVEHVSHETVRKVLKKT